MLAPEQSAVLRERLLGELGALPNMGAAADWAQCRLPAKNTLTAEDAQAIEAAFAARLAGMDIPADELHGPENARSANGQDANPKVGTEAATAARASAAEMPNAPALVVAQSTPERRRARLAAKTIRRRDKEHRKFVANQPCLVCGRTPADAHHLRFAQPRALGRKVSDEFTVPLCRTHHRQLHTRGDEKAWWIESKIDPLLAAQRLWNGRFDGSSDAERCTTTQPGAN